MMIFGYSFVEFFAIVAYYVCKIRLASLKNHRIINLKNKFKQALKGFL